MGTSSGGLLKNMCQTRFDKHLKLTCISRKLAYNIFTLMILCSSFVLCKQPLSSFNSLEAVHYCSFSTPLKTTYLTPYYEANRDIEGCASGEKTKSGVIVHVVQLNTTTSNVLLTVSGKKSRI